MTLSNNQIDELGKRLRNTARQGETPRKEDLERLDEFRQTYNIVDEHVYHLIEEASKDFQEILTITKRKRKTQQSIIAKLLRMEQTKLSRMQNIAGCRMVVKNGIKQTWQVHQSLVKKFKQKVIEAKSSEIDRHAYRAIHIIVKYQKKSYEIQLRTYAQDFLANLIESLSNQNNTLKYGGTDDEQSVIKKMHRLSDSFVFIDENAHEQTFYEYQKQIEGIIKNVLPD